MKVPELFWVAFLTVIFSSGLESIRSYSVLICSTEKAWDISMCYNSQSRRTKGSKLKLKAQGTGSRVQSRLIWPYGAQCFEKSTIHPPVSRKFHDQNPGLREVQDWRFISSTSIWARSQTTSAFCSGKAYIELLCTSFILREDSCRHHNTQGLESKQAFKLGLAEWVYSIRNFFKANEQVKIVKIVEMVRNGVWIERDS